MYRIQGALSTVFKLGIYPHVSPTKEHTVQKNITIKDRTTIKNQESKQSSMILHLNNYIIPIILLVSAAAPTPVAESSLHTRQDGSCDYSQGVYNNPSCPSGACCSSFGWCGYGTPWCPQACLPPKHEVCWCM